MKIVLLLILSKIIVGKEAAHSRPGPIIRTYKYENSKTKQVVVARFITEKHVVYTIRFLNKKTGTVCQTQGNAFWDDPTGNGTLVEDEAGNSYGVVDFHSKVAPLYTSLSFDYPQNGKVSPSRRLQVGAIRVSGKGACNFSSTHTLKRIN